MAEKIGGAGSQENDFEKSQELRKMTLGGDDRWCCEVREVTSKEILESQENDFWFGVIKIWTSVLERLLGARSGKIKKSR